MVGSSYPPKTARKMQNKSPSAHGLGNEVFAVGETVRCICGVRSLPGSLTEGHTYTVLEYHPSGTGNSYRSPAYVRVVGDCGSKLLLHPHRFAKIDHQPQTKEPA